MSSRDMYEVYEEETEGMDGGTNFGENMPLGQFMEDHGSGFSIRDSEEVITLGPDGVESELHGFNENIAPQMSIWVEEILDTLGPDQGEGVGPFDLECDFTLADYIMFRTSTREEVWNKKNQCFETKKHWVEKDGKRIGIPQVIQWNLDPVHAIEMAQMVFAVEYDRYDDDRWMVVNRAVQLHRMTEGTEDDSGLAQRYLSWAKFHHHVDNVSNFELPGFEFHYEPVIEAREDAIDASLTAHEQYDIAFLQEQEERETAESRYWDCFNEDGTKQLCGEEFIYRARLKQGRWDYTYKVLGWIEKVPPKSVSEAFAKGGVFQKSLRESRSTCLPPSGSYRTRFKTPAEVLLTKQQADLLMRAAEEKVNGTLNVYKYFSIVEKMEEESNRKKTA